jgi:hypothetical protein
MCIKQPILRRWRSLGIVALGIVGMGSLVAAQAQDTEIRHQFTFSWQFSDDEAMRPRGGTSRGAPVEFAAAPTAEWLALQEPGISTFERDRRAILAMAGGYRTSFDFLETVQFTPDAEPKRPYQSWGTEHVYVTADEGDYISLQHILVMFFVDDSGVVSEPVVMKHWRQDWRYEDAELHVYAGLNRWEARRVEPEKARGTWTQAVFQVDDGPRYESIGRWEHKGNVSSWTGEPTWRPLPRREYSVRDDYDVLEAVNTHTIVPNGWVHEENNLKLDLDADGRVKPDTPYLARELGVNRYERIEGFDFSAGDQYWERTGPFWSDVRMAWQDIMDQHARFAVAEHVDGRSLYEYFFEQADGRSTADNRQRDRQRRIAELLDRFVVPLPR